MTRNRTHGRLGFTLVELIVVVGLMGMLATVSIGGYFAAARGMAARGIVQDTSSLIRQAMQTCLIDQTPTAVIFLNRRIGKKEDGGEAHGRAIAIKMAGRISYVAKSRGKTSEGNSVSFGGGAMLIDEFADWNQSYSVDGSEKANQLGTRIFRMFSGQNGFDSLGSGLNRCSSLMCSWVGYREFDTDFLASIGLAMDDWCNSNNKTESDNRAFSGIGYRNANNYRWGMPFHPDNNGLRATDWRVGDGYGVEIASLDLPKNYIFGKKAPNDADFEAASSPSRGAIVFTPGMVRNFGQYNFNAGVRVEVSVLNDVEGSDIQQIGVINDSMLEDQD